MTEAEKLLRKLGATCTHGSKHNHFFLDGVKFSLHRGSKPNESEIYKVKKQLRRMGRIPT